MIPLELRPLTLGRQDMAETMVKTIYVSVKISIDLRPLRQSFCMNFPENRQEFYIPSSDQKRRKCTYPLELKPQHLTVDSGDADNPVLVREPTRLALVSHNSVRGYSNA